MLLFMLATAIAGPFAQSAGVELPADPVERQLLEMSGGVLLTTATPPPTVHFADALAVQSFQDGLQTGVVEVGGVSVTLQEPAAQALARARDELAAAGVAIRFQGKRPGARTWSEGHGAWTRRLRTSLEHWVGEGRLPASERDRILALPPDPQLRAVLDLEARGLWCNTYYNRTILSSVAAPGSSQHHAMLAVDVQPAKDPRVIEVMARHGWHRTVWSDRPHFTFLGVGPEALEGMGLRPKTWAEATFWVPDLELD